MNRARTDRRSAFTMIELLVVIAIVGVLAGLAIYFVPSFNTSAKAARGASELQQLLVAARQRSIRDQAPRGLRILFDPTTGLASKAQYLEQPDDLGGGWFFSGTAFTSLQLNKYQSPPQAALGNYTTFPQSYPYLADRLVIVTGADFTDGSVQPGDYLEINGGGLAHLIIAIQNSSTGKNVLVLASSLPNKDQGAVASSSSFTYALNTPINNFRIMRQPRVVGDEVFEMPRGIVVDGRLNGLANNALFPGIYSSTAGTSLFIEQLPTDAIGNLDIMFSPSGLAMPGRASKARIYLWVRSTDYDDTTAPSVFNGEPALIVVSINSGLVAAYPVNVGNASNPYDLTPLPW